MAPTTHHNDIGEGERSTYYGRRYISIINRIYCFHSTKYTNNNNSMLHSLVAGGYCGAHSFRFLSHFYCFFFLSHCLGIACHLLQIVLNNNNFCVRCIAIAGRARTHLYNRTDLTSWLGWSIRYGVFFCFCRIVVDVVVVFSFRSQFIQKHTLGGATVPSKFAPQTKPISCVRNLFLHFSSSLSLVAQGTLRKWETKRFTLYPIYRWNAKNKLSLSSGCTQNVLFTFENNHVDKNAPKNHFTPSTLALCAALILFGLLEMVFVYIIRKWCVRTRLISPFRSLVFLSHRARTLGVSVRIPTTTKSRRWW